MNLRQQIVTERIAEVATTLNLPHDKAFVRLAHHLITGQSIHAFDPSDLTEGGQDKQIDVLSIEEGTDQATVYILQVKNTESFSSKKLSISPLKFPERLPWLSHAAFFV